MFRSVISNVGGHYSPLTGLFTCPVRGIYMFHYSVLGDNTYNWRGRMLQSGEMIASSISLGFIQMSNLAFVECDVGEQVWVEANGTGDIFGDDERRYSSFTGALMRKVNTNKHN